MSKQRLVSDHWLIPILKGLVPTKQFDAFIHTHPENVWQSAVQAGLVSDEQILHAVAQRAHMSIAERDLATTQQAHQSIPEHVARRYSIVPLSVSDSTLRIATGNPYDFDCEQALGFFAGRRVEMALASPSRIAERIDELYQTNSSSKNGLTFSELINSLADDLKATFGSANSDEHLARAATSESLNRPIIQLVDHIVSDGIGKRASDIHLESEESGIAIRYRIDGVLQHTATLPKLVGLPLVSRIKIMAQMDIADRLRPQGGRVRVTLNNTPVDLRVSTLPAAHGEKVVIRILNSGTTLHSVDTLDLPNATMARLKRLLDTREGLILITGPTGSGKTTTLYAALQQLLKRGLNIITVEDPVEYRVPGIVQVQVNEKAGLTFSAALRSILRQDPDVVLIGEVRDRETAAIAIQAALTGHLVFATLHTIDACSSITRLHDLGIEPTKVSTALKGVIAQRLVRKLCNNCMTQSLEPIPQRLWHAIPSGATLYGPSGCKSCSETGYLGRTAVTELVTVSPALERLIASGAHTQALSDCARQEGSQSLWDVGVTYLLHGITSANEITRVIEPENSEISDRDGDSDGNGNGDGESNDVVSRDVPTAFPPESGAQGSQHMKTNLEVGVIDVYLIDNTKEPWSVLALQRAYTTDRKSVV